MNNQHKSAKDRKTILVDIVSAEGTIFNGPAYMVVVPAVMGEMGILPRHSPLLTRLQPGEVRIDTPEGEVPVYTLGGFIEIQPSIVTILSDTALRGDRVDEESAAMARQQAEETKRQAEEFLQQNIPNFDYAKAKQELAQAIAQLRTLDDLQKRVGRGKKARKPAPHSTP